MGEEVESRTGVGIGYGESRHGGEREEKSMGRGHLWDKLETGGLLRGYGDDPS